MPVAAPARLALNHLAWHLLSIVIVCWIRTAGRYLISSGEMSTTSEQAPFKPALRAKAPKHIHLPHPSPSSEVPYSRTYPATPALSPRSQREPVANPFFILDEETPPIPTPRVPRFPPSPPTHIRRPTLPAQISLEHALGDTRRSPVQPQDGRPKKEATLPSPAASCSCASSRSQPEMGKFRKKTKNRPRAKTDLPPLDTAGWSLHTPSFRSTAAATPSTGSSTPRNISISEIPLMSGPIGCAVDVFGLAALQPPRIGGRPRPRMRQRATIGDVSAERVDVDSSMPAVPGGLVFAGRTANPVKA
ncbi:hypothetical protein ACGC1H_001296 [Rhizoctonia solani]|uniref:Uncharacterized protein n=1 Tax=Rhizoctonia solani TaxID=456999 RepID=A0A8H3ANW4_9AGAM|nr:unnamed protein product [Rhizoctonia solani]